MIQLIERAKVAMMCWTEGEWFAFICLVAVFVVLLTGKIHIGA